MSRMEWEEEKKVLSNKLTNLTGTSDFRWVYRNLEKFSSHKEITKIVERLRIIHNDLIMGG